MKIVIAPQGFKGSMSAAEAARAMEQGVKAFDKAADTVVLPVADGGAGTVDALAAATGGRLVEERVHGPLGEPITAAWGLSGDSSTAFIEVAAASGLALVPLEKRNPLHTTTFGTGELILAALERGISRMVIGLGDSATVDGGTGIAAALGVKFLDAKGNPAPPGGEGLLALDRIDVSARTPLLEGCRIDCACDVTNPLYGPDGAAYVYGPQKGADARMVERLDAALFKLDAVIKKDLGLDVAGMPGAGAAGGLGAGLTAFLGVTLRRGVELVCDTIGFDAYVKDADLVLTGEGRLDFQTAYGKAAAGIARRAKAFGKPVIAICGYLGKGYKQVYKLGIDKAVSITPPGMSVAEAMRRGPELLAAATERVLRQAQDERWGSGS